jgi:hypothetical protein
MRGADDLTRPCPQIHTSRHQLKEHGIMFQLRIYTLRSPEALQQYATVHWARHPTTFKTFGVTTHGVWTERSDGANRLVALIRYPSGADPEQLTRHVMTSPEFAADMAGFDANEIVDVQSVLLDPTSFSPIR